MKIIGIDYGSKWVGVAVSDDLFLFAEAHGVLAGGDDEDLLNKVQEVIDEVQACEIVVGFPLNMDGTISMKAREVEELVEKMRNRYDLPVHVWDERLSTVDAERKLREAGVKARDRKRKIDAAAAQVILQNYLNWRYRQRESDGDAHPPRF